MPEYSFRNPKTNQVVIVFQNMNDPHVYEENGVVFEREWNAPNAAMDSKVDVFSREDFMKKTAKSDNIGALWDRSKEWSERRKAITGGPDAVKTKYLKEEQAKGRAGKERAKIIEQNDKDPAPSRKKNG